MITDQEYAQLAARAYAATDENRTPIPDWTELDWIPDRSYGFSAGVYQRGEDIVIAYTGTNQAADWGWANGLVGLGLPSPQIMEAMLIYITTKKEHPTANITFTGHSLGGGLASVMSIFFNRPATVFDHAPFELGARNLVALAIYRAELAALGFSDQAFEDYWLAAPTVFYQREAAVRGIYLKGEALESGRTLWPTITGPYSNAVDPGAPVGATAINLHSMVLLASMMTSSAFSNTVKDQPELIALLFDEKLYKRDSKTSNSPDFLARLYGAQIGQPATPLLDRFAADLNKISKAGTTQNEDVHKALAVATMDYYYINPVDKVNGLFSVSDGAIYFKYDDIPGNTPKSLEYLTAAVNTITKDVDTITLSVFARQARDWHIQTGDSTVNISSTTSENNAVIGGAGGDRATSGTGNDLLIGLGGNDTLSGGGGSDLLLGGDGSDDLHGEEGYDELYGGSSSDTLSGGNGKDSLYGGDDADTLDGGEDDDRLFGGGGNDTYEFKGNFGTDFIDDSDGIGKISIEKLGGTPPKGILQPEVISASSKLYKSDDGKVSYLLEKRREGVYDLIISLKDSEDKIHIKNWSTEHNFGIELDDTAKAAKDPVELWTGDFAKNLNAGNALASVNPATDLLSRPFSYVSDGPQAGAKDIFNGTAVGDTIFGLAGSDGIQGGSGEDYIDGGDGSDMLLGGLGQDTIVAGAGDDYVFGSATGCFNTPEFNNYTAKPGDLQGARLATGYNWDVVEFTTAGGKTTFQVEGVNTMSYFPLIDQPGYAGHEIAGNLIVGGAGNDFIAAGTAGDTVYGGLDNDTVFGLAEGDAIFGDEGDDLIWGDGTPADSPIYTDVTDHGNDTLDGGAGKDQLVGQGGDDELYGGAGDDRLLGDDDDYTNTPTAIHGNDYLDGGDDNDTLIGGGRDDELFGGKGDDRLFGDNFDKDLPIELHGKDYLDGEDGDDQLSGQGGDDELFGGKGKDSLWGDVDMASHSDSQAKGDDYLDGEEDDDTLVGGRGNDTLYGGSENDGLVGDDNALAAAEHGNDELYGEAGQDTLEGNGGDDLLDGGDDGDTLHGGKGQDTLYGGSGQDRINGDEDNDTIVGGTGADDLQGGDGDDTYLIDAGDAAPTLLNEAETITDSSGNNKIVFGGGINKGGVLAHISDGNLIVQMSSTDVLIVENSGISNMSFSFSATGETLSSSQLISQTASAPTQYTDPDGNVHYYGSNNANQLTVAGLNSTVYGGFGNDVITALNSGVNVQFSLGDGADHVQFVKDTTGRQQNRLTFGAGISASNVSWTAEGNSMKLSVGGGTDAIYIDNFDAATAAQSLTLDQLVFDDATITAADLLNQSSFSTGTSGADLQQGAFGADVFVASAGNDTMRGWQGGDTYTWGLNSGQDVINDGVSSSTDVDVLVINPGLKPQDVMLTKSGNDLVIKLHLAADTITVTDQFAGKGLEKIVFSDTTTWSADYIASHLATELSDSGTSYTADASDNVISGRGGNDTLYGMAGNDVLDGGTGSDKLYGGNDNDTLIGGASYDELYGEAGDDVLDGRGDSNVDSLYGGAGSDTYLFGRGSGSDQISDTGTLASDIDTLKFDDDIKPSDLVFGTYGSSRQIGIRGTNDSIRFSMTVPGSGTVSSIEQIVFGDGTTWDWNAYVAQSVLSSATEGNDSIIGFDTDETINGLGGNDDISGNGGNDIIDGGTGVDNLSGGNGDDTLINGETMNGGAGSDTFILKSWQDALVLESPYLSSDNDTLVLPVASTAIEAIKAGGNNAPYWYTDLNLSAFVEGNKSTVIVQDFFRQAGGGTIEYIQFSDGQTWSYETVLENLTNGTKASAGNDSIVGNLWDDTLNGLGGDDSITGGPGNDYLNGGQGHDVLIGGTGADKYYFDSASGQDRIEESGEYQFETDTIILGSEVSEADISLHQNGFDLILQIGNSATQLTVANYFAATSPSRDFKIEQIQFTNTTPPVVWDAAKIASVIKTGAIDSITGTSANDTFNIDNSFDSITEAINGGQDTVRTPVSYWLPDNIENLTATGTLNIDLFGNVLTNTLTGNSGNNIFNGYDSVWWATHGGYPTSAGDTMIGGAGDDTYFITPITGDSGTIIENKDEGTDTAMVLAYDYVLPENVENVILLPSTTWYTSGNTGENIRRNITGNGLANRIDATKAIVETRLDGGEGADTLIGSARWGDIFVVDNKDDLVSEYETGQGIDLVESSVSYSLAASLEWLTLTGSDAITGTGNDQANQIDGSSNVASNMLIGGKGDDTYIVDQNDFITEAVDGGDDTVVIAYGMEIDVYVDPNRYINVEKWELSDNMSYARLIGDSGNNVLIGNRYNNVLIGADGDDDLFDGPGNLLTQSGAIQSYQVDYDQLFGGAGNDRLTAVSRDGVDMLDGGTGNDTIRLLGYGSSQVVFGRGYQLDTVTAYARNTTQWVQFNADTAASDLVYTRAGTDVRMAIAGTSDVLVWSNFYVDDISSTLSGNFSYVQFSDNAQLSASQIDWRIRHSNQNVIDNAGSVLIGSTGSDAIQGGDGNDLLIGDAGVDTLVGSLGADTMVGGTEDDTYVVDDMGDVVVETLGADSAISYDTIQSSVSYMAPDNVEALVLTGTADIDATSNNNGCDLTGNTGNNYLKGGDGLDFIYGDEGVDTLEGGAGDDYYYLTDNSDTVIEEAGGGLDQIWAYGDGIKMANNVERLYMQSYLARTAYGNAGNNLMAGNNRANTLYGNGGNDKLFGYSGDDTLYGGLGNDSLYGSVGNDVYHFQRGDGQDTIYDLDSTSGARDKLALDGAVSSSQVWLARSGDDLVVSIIGTTDKVSINSWYLGDNYKVESITAAGNGKTLDYTKVDALVSAMASLSAPTQGQTDLSPYLHSKLDSLLASSWT